MPDNNIPIYLDNNASTPIRSEVLDALCEAERNFCGNPSSNHIFGWRAKEAIRIAQEEISEVFEVEPDGVIFTSGATEANNIFLQGAIHKALTNPSISKPSDILLLISKLEHSSVARSAEYLQSQLGCSVKQLDNKSDGVIIEHEEPIVSPFCIASVQLANNEIGVLQPIPNLSKKLSKACPGSLFHSDITQAFSKIPCSLNKLSIDAASLSAHKFGGPKGIGALLLKKASTLSQLSPVFQGGLQQGELRSGSLPLGLILALAKAITLGHMEQKSAEKRLRTHSEYLFATLHNSNSSIKLIGPEISKRVPGNISIRIPGIRSSEIISALSTQLAISSSSACQSRQAQGSHVLKSIGLVNEELHEVVRIGIGVQNTKEELDLAAHLLLKTIKALSK